MAVLIDDKFTGGAENADLGGTTPDTTNTPGDTWTDAIANEVEFDASAQIKVSGSATNSRINTGVDHHKVSIDYNAGGADNRAHLAVRGSDHALNNSSRTGYFLNFKPDTDNIALFKGYIGGLTQIGSNISVSMNNPQQHKFTFEINGDVKKLYVDDNLEHTESVDSTYDTGTYAGLAHALYTDGAARFDDFLVEEIAAGGLSRPLSRPFSGPLGGI